MHNFWTLLKYELAICHRSYHLFRHSAYIMLLSTIILSIIIESAYENESSGTYIKIMMIIFGSVMPSITVPSHLVKSEMQDGALENLFVFLKPLTILMAKYCGILILVGSGIFGALPIITVFYNLQIEHIILLLVIIILLLVQIVAIVLLCNIIHAYFRQNTNFILTIILPLIIPSLIIATMAVKTFKIDFICILLGMDMIFIPIILMLSNYLLATLYEF